jgi:hypothetical protein
MARSAHRPVPAAASPLRRPEDAIDVLLAVATHPPCVEAIALVLDRAHRGLGCMVVDGAGPTDLVTLTDVLLEAATERDHVGAFVLATTRVTGIWPGPAEELLWFSLRERVAEAGYELLDWFVLVADLAVSMAEITDSATLWLAGG